MSALSPWNGASRSPLRLLLGALMAFDALLCAGFVARLKPSDISHPHAPHGLLWLGSNLPALAALALLGVVASLLFVRRPGALLAGVVSVVSAGVLVEAQGALLEGPMRFLFFSGATMLGWLLGLAFARWQKLDARRAEDSLRVEALAEQGAIGALAACYLGALVSKLAAAGLDWAVHGGLRADIAGQHAWGHSRLLDALTLLVLDHAWVSYLLGAFTLLAQASAILMPYSRRGRTASGALLLLFHAGVWLLTPILFPQAMLLLLAFCFPWPRVWTNGRAPEVALPASRPAISRLLIIVALVVGVAWLPPLRAYTQLRHFRSRGASAVTASARTRLGDLVEGASVGGFRIERIEQAGPDDIRLQLTRGADSAVVELARHGVKPFLALKTVNGFDLFYQRGEGVSEDTQRSLLDEVAKRLPLH